jgi:hypothetical protein
MATRCEKAMDFGHWQHRHRSGPVMQDMERELNATGDAQYIHEPSWLNEAIGKRWLHCFLFPFVLDEDVVTLTQGVIRRGDVRCCCQRVAHRTPLAKGNGAHGTLTTAAFMIVIHRSR